MKFNIGDKLHISGDIEITGEQTHNNGSYSYNTNMGVTFPAYVLEKLVCTAASVKPYAEPARPTAPANKYDAMSDNDLVFAVCDMGTCSASASDIRHADCPLKNTPAYNSPTTKCTDFLHAHPEFRPVLVQYLVDENAAKEPKPEPRPFKELYSGKVVCVETHDDFTVGKVYTFVQGKVTDDSWTRRPMSSFVAESLEAWNSRYCYSVARFVEYKGEA